MATEDNLELVVQKVESKRNVWKHEAGFPSELVFSIGQTISPPRPLQGQGDYEMMVYDTPGQFLKHLDPFQCPNEYVEICSLHSLLSNSILIEGVLRRLKVAKDHTSLLMV